ncbi:MAG: DedA family protein [Planctomycetes bacterium]|jgi:membrane protein DedA with SNARE-associated domain|nr:DedA family protein [Planctomycetota bacterium]
MNLLLAGFLDRAWAWLTEIAGILGYPGIVGFMAVESSFIPFPSEIVMPPAGALARSGDLDLVLVILCGIAGSLAGALVNYYLALGLGRPFCLRYGKYFLLSERKFHKAEDFFRRHGEITTFVCRLLPGIRQLISIPAGLARMALPRFLLFTALGSGIWVTVLTLIGYWVGTDLDVVKRNSHRILLVMAPALLVIILGYIWFCRRRRAREAARAAEVGE